MEDSKELLNNSTLCMSELRTSARAFGPNSVLQAYVCSCWSSTFLRDANRKISPFLSLLAGGGTDRLRRRNEAEKKVMLESTVSML